MLQSTVQAFAVVRLGGGGALSEVWEAWVSTLTLAQGRQGYA